jgi:GNAT superfamily N-acetyltransferase
MSNLDQHDTIHSSDFALHTVRPRTSLQLAFMEAARRNFPFKDEAHFDTWRGIYSSPVAGRNLVLTRNDFVLGIATLRKARPDRALLENLMVEDGYRGFGFGSALLAGAEALAQWQGNTSIELTSRAEQWAFYAARGYLREVAPNQGDNALITGVKRLKPSPAWVLGR